MNYEVARHNMVEQQVRTWEVLDAQVLDVLSEMPREEFVPPRHRKLAYADLMLPLEHDEVMMKPVVEGRLLQAVLAQPGEHVAEVGTGSGYLAACLAKLGAQVETVELHDDLLRAAESRWQSLGITNIKGSAQDALDDWKPATLCDAVVVTGAVHQINPVFRDWLKPEGRLFVIEGRSPVMEAALYTRTAGDGWKKESLFETDLRHLRGAEPPELFAL